MIINKRRCKDNQTRMNGCHIARMPLETSSKKLLLTTPTKSSSIILIKVWKTQSTNLQFPIFRTIRQILNKMKCFTIITIKIRNMARKKHYIIHSKMIKMKDGPKSIVVRLKNHCIVHRALTSYRIIIAW